MPIDNRTSPLLLDTHYWIWLQFGIAEQMTSQVRSSVDYAAATGRLLLSVISVWEVALLESKGRIDLYMPCEDWVKRALAMSGLTLAPLTPEIAIESTRLPKGFHGDPADRIIFATARKTGARLVTSDRKMRAYAAKQGVPIL